MVDGDKINWTSKEEVKKYKLDEYARLGEKYDWINDKGTCEPLHYVDGIEGFPASAPLDHPHIIDIEQFNDKTVKVKLRMCDAIATELYNWKPEAAMKFFDLKNKCVQYNWEVEDYLTGASKMFYRKGNKVMVSHMTSVLGRHELTRCPNSSVAISMHFPLERRESTTGTAKCGFEIAEDGRWKTVFAIEHHPHTHLSEVPYPDDPWGDGDTEDLAISVKATRMEVRGRAKYILEDKAWDEDDSRADYARIRTLTLRVDGKVEEESIWTTEGKPGPLDHMQSNPELSALLEILGLAAPGE